ncbi:MAG: hypothetical protein ACTSRA_01095 [Promethearchaeota archaeon]
MNARGKSGGTTTRILSCTTTFLVINFDHKRTIKCKITPNSRLNDDTTSFCP